jgi:signal transduction histidine kinase
MSEGKRADEHVATELFNGDAATFLMAAHELKSPLALIRQLALGLESGHMATHEQERLFMQIRLTSEKALRLTGDITKTSRNDTLFDLEPLNPISVCEEVAHELAPLFAAQNKRIEIPSRSRAPLLVGNRDLLRRILLNFGDNALHYAPSGEAVEMKVTHTGDTVRIGVRDFGPAVSVDLWQVLLGRLQSQTAQPVSARPQSSGLGLYIAGRFAGFMNGQIGATRHRNGATFYVDMAASKQLSLL